MPNTKKIIAVVGATGAQGGGLVRAILNDPKKRFRARAITRDTKSKKAMALKELGAEIVKADLDDVESLKKAFDGAYGAYCVTNFWEHFSPEREISQATNMAKAASYEAVEHIIWSTLEDTRQWVPLSDKSMPTLMRKYKVPHYDGKGEANREFTLRELPVTFFLTSYYWDNLIHFGAEPKRDADGVLNFVLPIGNKRLPGMAAEDVGKCAFGIFTKPREYIGETVGVAGGHLTGEQMAAALTRALGQKVRYQAVEPAEYAQFGFPGAADLANMHQFKRDFNDYYCGARDLDESRALNPDLMSFDAWLQRYKDQIPIDRAAA